MEGIAAIHKAIDAYYEIIASPEFQRLERMREDARYNEAAALHHARQQEREKWQSVVADKDAENEQLRSRIAELEKRN